MAQPKKKVGVRKSKAQPKLEKKPLPPIEPENVKSEQDKLDEIDNIRFIELIEIVRTTNNPKTENAAFVEIYEKLKPRIQKMTNRFTIPGLNHDDILQEALVALHSKAIKDYDQTRGSGEGPAQFDRFALLCIRRHLSTEFKSSLQNNRKKVLNQSLSLDQEHRGNNDNLTLASIIPSMDGDILNGLQDREYFRNLITGLVKHLSPFERKVLSFYAQRLSYEEIADKINEHRVKIKVNVKGIDNALSRIKKKARSIITEQDKVESKDIDNAIRQTKRNSKKISEDDDLES
jgi:RNA polymerase sigma factor (sigma-70 family)